VVTYANTAASVTLFGADQFGESISYTVDGLPAHGALTGVAPNLVYTPANNFSGLDSFTFKVNNRFAVSADATVSIIVRSVIGAGVTPLADSGPGSLRAALALANADNFNLWRISFASSLSNQPVLLSSAGDNGFGPSALVVSNLLVIDGGNAGVT